MHFKLLVERFVKQHKGQGSNKSPNDNGLLGQDLNIFLQFFEHLPRPPETVVKNVVDVQCVNNQDVSCDSFILDAPAASCAAELYRPHSSITDMKSCHNSDASSSSALFVAAGRDPRRIGFDASSPNSLFDRPKAPKFKKRGCRAGKARNATADGSSGCTQTE